jgi:hypothetical protein
MLEKSHQLARTTASPGTLDSLCGVSVHQSALKSSFDKAHNLASPWKRQGILPTLRTQQPGPPLEPNGSSPT